jgi:hypothetical protein
MKVEVYHLVTLNLTIIIKGDEMNINWNEINDLILTCDYCSEDFGPFLSYQKVKEHQKLNGWERSKISNGQYIDGCGDCIERMEK